MRKRSFPFTFFVLSLLLIALLLRLMNDSDRFIEIDDKSKRESTTFAYVDPLSGLACTSQVAKCSEILGPENIPKTSGLYRGTGAGSLLDFQRVILIVSFNTPQFEAIPKIRALYEGIFQKIVYCMTNITALTGYDQSFLNQIFDETIVEFSPTQTNPSGAIFYACIPAVLEGDTVVRNLVETNQTSGFLHISDDLIVNIWNFETGSLSLDASWLLSPAVHLYDIDTLHICKGIWWDNAIDCTDQEAWDVLTAHQRQAQSALDEAEKRFPHFIESLAVVSRGKRRVWNVYADLFYVARDDLLLSAKLFKLFAKHGVYMELAVGTILRGVARYSAERNGFVGRRLYTIPRVPGQLWGPVRNLPVNVTYNARSFIYHPFKMGNIERASVDQQCMFCVLLQKFNEVKQLFRNNSVS